MKRWLDVLIPGLLLLGAALLRADESLLALQLRNLVFDSYQRALPRAWQDLPVRIVDIDEESLRRLGQWPWPRNRLARMVDRLGAAGAAVVTFDVLLSEPDRLAPSELTTLWRDRPESASLQAVLGLLPDPDAELQASISRTPTVTAFALTQEPGGRTPASKASFATAGDDPRQFLIPYSGSTTTLPELEGAAAGNGSVTFVPDTDGVLRRVPLLVRYGEEIYPSLAGEALRVAQGASNYIVKSTGASEEANFGGASGIAFIRIGEPIVPTDGDGRMLLYDSGHRPERFLPAWRVLASDFDPASVAGRIVLVGTSAEALKDLRATPIDPAMAGVEIHAQIVEQIIGGQFLTRPDWATGAELVALILLGLVLIFAIRRVGALWALLIALAGGGAMVAFSWYGFAARGWLIDPLYPCLVALLVYLSGSLIGYLRTEGEKRFVRGAFGRYLSPVLVEELTRNPERLKLGGETRELTLLFSDIRGFTHIAESLDPQELTRLINRFLTPLTRVIQQSGGTIDKYMGDCIMAFWYAPLDVPDHAVKAAQAALAMRTEL
ncbi:MAG: CHASE2 domain-containing protein, partial [Dongiaceae bacterium]